MFFFMFLIFFLSLGFKSRPELAIFSTFQPLSDLCQCLFHEIWNTHTKGWVEESWGSCSNQQIYILYIVQFWTFAFFSKFSREILKLSFYMIFYISIGSENHIGSAPNFFLNCNHGYELCGTKIKYVPPALFSNRIPKDDSSPQILWILCRG